MGIHGKSQCQGYRPLHDPLRLSAGSQGARLVLRQLSSKLPSNEAEGLVFLDQTVGLSRPHNGLDERLGRDAPLGVELPGLRHRDGALPG